MTMTQKILAAHSGLESVKAGQLIEANLDLVLGNDITSPVAINEFYKLKLEKVFNKEKVAIVPDHFTPNKDIKSAKIQEILIEKINEKQGKTVLRPSQEGTITNTIPNTNSNSILDKYNFSAEVRDSIIKWLNYKKEKKQTYKEIGLTTLLNKLLKQGKDYGDKYVIDSIENSIINNYSGIFPPTETKSYGKSVVVEKPTSELKGAEKIMWEEIERVQNEYNVQNN